MSQKISMLNIRLPNIIDRAKSYCKILNNAGYEAYIVGGAVRDILLGLFPNDVDITTNALPTEVTKVFTERSYEVIPVGEKFGTVIIVDKSMMEPIEVTTYRSEGRYSDKRHPDEVKFETSLIKDLERRDFTINAMAFDPLTNIIIDPFNGYNDLGNNDWGAKILRAVGNAEERFKEDPLRMLRMCRLACKLEFILAEDTFRAAQNLHSLIREIPAERVKDELFKMLTIPDPTWAFYHLDNTDLIMDILPEVGMLKLAAQPKQYHKYSVMYHMFETAKFIPETKPLLRFAALIHDVGKTHMNMFPPYFPMHVKDGQKLFEDISKRLKLSNEEHDYIVFIMEHHMDQFGFKNMTSDSSLRKWMSKMGENIKYLGDLFIIFYADNLGTGIDKPETIKRTQDTHIRCEGIIATKQPLSIKDLVIDGHDLMAIGIPASPVLGEIQKLLLVKVIEDPQRNTRNYLLNYAFNFYLEYISPSVDRKI